MLWQQNSIVNVPPAAGAGVVVVMDRGGTTTAFEEATAPLESGDAGQCCCCHRRDRVVIQDQTAHALSTVSGRHRWAAIFGTDRHGEFRRPIRGRHQEPVRHAERRRCGHSTTRASPHPTPTQDHLVAWGPTEALVIARDGKIITRWAGAHSGATGPPCPRNCASAVQQRLDVPGLGRCRLTSTHRSLRCWPAPALATAAEPEDGTSDLSRSRSRLARFAAGLYRQTLVEPVEQGRLRDLEWPYARSIVLAGYVVLVIAGLMVIFPD